MHCLKHNDHNMMLIDGGKAKRQPIIEFDINQVLDNIIKMPETKGQTYEIGGPTVYTIKELFEFMANNLNRRITYTNFTYDDLMRTYLSPNTNWEKSAHWYIIRPDYLTRQRVDNVIVKREGVKTIEDLHIQPLAIHHYISDICNMLTEKVAPINQESLSYEELIAEEEGY
jgi:NADH dehydrogenase (ubiquinone) 1 alpha subcomplex subunit 9